VLGYAESAECRRAVQLRYFGELLAAPCNGCDNCREPRPMQDHTLAAQQFLSCVARLAQRRERYGSAYVIDILRGAQSQRLLDNGHASLSVYGIGNGRSVEEWRRIAQAMRHQGLVDETQDGYPVLVLNERSWQVLRGDLPVHIAQARAPQRSKRARHASGAEADVSAQTDDALFQALRTLRKKLADSAGVPPYVVFHDSTLREMAQRLPPTLAELATIPGIGEAKLARYGRSFLAVIQEFAAARSSIRISDRSP
jgi:ATP-dependent DNA helicase RecQ